MRWKAGVWIKPVRTISRRKCDSEWAREKNNCAWHWVIAGAVTRDAMCKYVWVLKNECKICGELGTEKDRLHHCNWVRKLETPEIR